MHLIGYGGLLLSNRASATTQFLADRGGLGPLAVASNRHRAATATTRRTPRPTAFVHDPGDPHAGPGVSDDWHAQTVRLLDQAERHHADFAQAAAALNRPTHH